MVQGKRVYLWSQSKIQNLILIQKMFAIATISDATIKISDAIATILDATIRISDAIATILDATIKISDATTRISDAINRVSTRFKLG
ncbi:hypothetical protein AMR41_05660 [Hapalosiphon sp. MRB220]|nr:hypothetical protein AMR41_05660 [Hapalosiphon sp. MRB220]